jgi:polyribonucleotide nucleotidyltransferase
MKEISEAEMLKQLNLHTNTSKPNWLNCVCKPLWKKKKFVLRRRKRRQLFTQSKAASYDKIYAIASKGSAKQERTAAFEAVRRKKRCLLKKN